MPLPDSVATATVNATFVDASGATRSGTVTFRPNTRVTVGSTGITVDPVIVELIDGKMTATIAATDDPDLSPSGWAYTIIVEAGRTRFSQTSFVPAAGSPHDLFDLIPVSPVDPVSPDVKSVNGILPNPTTGNVDLGPISAPVTSVAGKTGAVTLVKADVGLANVDNTSDAAKPLSAADIAALAGKSDTGHNHTGTYSPVGHTHAQADVTGLVTGLAAKQDDLTFVQAYLSAGNVNLNTATSSWAVLSGSPTLSIPAAVGDRIGFDASIGRQANSNLYMDIGVVVSGTIRRWLGNGSTVTPDASYEGDIALYHTNVPARSGERRFVVTSNDLDGSNVVFAIVARSIGSGSALVLMSTANPGYWQATNYRQ